MQKNSIKDASLKNVKSIQNLENEKVRKQTLYYLIIILISASMMFKSIRFFLKWWRPSILILKLRSLKDKSKDPKRDIEIYLSRLNSDEKKRKLIQLFRETLERNKGILRRIS